MPTTPTSSETVTLAPGLVVRLDALTLLWDLEARHCTIRLNGEQLLIGPRTILTDDDRAAIRQHKPELVHLVQFVELVQ